jgi:hypothetical protein
MADREKPKYMTMWLKKTHSNYVSRLKKLPYMKTSPATSGSGGAGGPIGIKDTVKDAVRNVGETVLFGPGGITAEALWRRMKKKKAGYKVDKNLPNEFMRKMKNKSA